MLTLVLHSKIILKKYIWILVNYNKCQTRGKDEDRDKRREGNTHEMEYTQLTENHFW